MTTVSLGNIVVVESDFVKKDEFSQVTKKIQKKNVRPSYSNSRSMASGEQGKGNLERIDELQESSSDEGESIQINVGSQEYSKELRTG